MTAAAAHSPMTANWASGAFAQRTIPAPQNLPKFDRLVYKLGLEDHPELWRDSQVLKQFAKANKNIRYVPESLLNEWGMRVCVEGHL